MNVKEFRIGNFINTGIVLTPVRLASISNDCPFIKMGEPIKLTIDWLLKFGF